jgi:hypothetical protein
MSIIASFKLICLAQHQNADEMLPLNLHLTTIRLPLPIILLFLVFTDPLVADVNFLAGPGSDRLRQCAQDGVIDPNGPGKLGCAVYSYACQSLFSKVVTAVSTAVENHCENNQYDVTSAILTVFELCTANGFTPPLTITASPPTG